MSMIRIQETVAISGTKLGESAKAIHFKVQEVNGEELSSPKNEWFPFSQVKKIVTATNMSGEMDELEVSKWIMQQKGYDV